MFSGGEDVEADALFKRGWTISAIARHLDCDRKTVRAYLSGERTPGVRRTECLTRSTSTAPMWRPVRRRPAPVGLGPVRRGGRPRVSLVLCSFARQLRLAGLRPHCEACSGVKGRETIEIDHPSGEEIQWDWFERRKAPGARRPMGCSARCPTRGGPGGCSPSPWTSPISSRPWTASCDVWAAPPGSGAPTAWPR